MKREVARKIADALKKMDDVFQEISLLIHEVEDASERRALARGLGELIGDSHVKITLIVANQYPDMHPDNVEGGWTYKPSSASSSRGR
jgi:hypothetical protein